MIQINRVLAFCVLCFVLLYSLVPNPSLFAANETLAYDSQTGSFTAVKSYVAQEQAGVPSEQSLLPQDFLTQDNPLSPASEPAVVTEEPQAEDPTEPSADKDQPQVFVEDFEESSYVAPLNSDAIEALTNDTYSGTFAMWGFDKVQAEKAWGISRGLNATVAIIDTGIDFAHVDRGNLWTNSAEVEGNGVDDDGNGFVDDIHGWNFVSNNGNPQDDNGHGAHVAGIVNAKANNQEGIAGVAPDAQIMALKVLNAAGSGFISNVINAINYAVKFGAQVINMSLGILKKYLSSMDLKNFQSAVDNAKAKGTIVVAAAGNESIDTSLTAPGGLNNVIAVGAVDSNNRRASFSNKNPDLVAPGVTIGSLKLGGGYIYMSGTSMASPYVAGVAALLKALNPGLTYDDVYTRLTRSSTDLGRKGYDSSFGYGLLNAYGALTYIPVAAASVPAAIREITPKYNLNFLVRGAFSRFSFDSPQAYFPVMGNWYRLGYDEEEMLRLKKKKKKHL